MFCIKCGHRNNETGIFCINCGHNLKSDPNEGEDTTRLKQKFPGLKAELYEHPDDTKAIKTMQKIPLMEEVIKQVFKQWRNLNYEITLTANSVKVTERQFPDIYELFEDCGEILDLKRLPKLYIGQEPKVYAYTTGVEETFLVLTSGLVDLMTKDELAFIIGHEMGHIKSNHVIYHDVVSWIKNIGTTVGNFTFGMGEIIGAGLMTALTGWLKKSEFTADRAGLLACQDIDTATRALIKMALGSRKLFSQISIEEYLRQGEELEDDEEKGAAFKAARMMQNAVLTQPFITSRVKQLQDWVKSEDYKRIIEGDFQNSSDVPTEDLSEEEMIECLSCNGLINKGENICPLCNEEVFKAPPICPECFRDLKVHQTKCPHCKKDLSPSKTKRWIKNKYKNVKSFFGENISNIGEKIKKYKNKEEDYED